MELLLGVMISLIIGLALFLISTFLMIGGLAEREQATPYECGFDSKQAGRVPFSVRFLFFVLLFLLFDVELVIFFHIPMIGGCIFNFSLMLSIFSLVVYFGFLLEEGEMIWE